MPRRLVNIELYDEAQETIREMRFKLRSFGVLIEWSKQQLPDKQRGLIDAAIWSLAQHTRGERPLTFVFQEQKVEEP